MIIFGRTVCLTTDESGVYIVIFYLLYGLSIPSRIHKCLSIFHEHYFRYIIYVHKYDLWDHSNCIYTFSLPKLHLYCIIKILLTRLIRQDQRIRKDTWCGSPILMVVAILIHHEHFFSFSMNASKKVRFFLCLASTTKFCMSEFPKKFQHKM